MEAAVLARRDVSSHPAKAAKRSGALQDATREAERKARESAVSIREEARSLGMNLYEVAAVLAVSERSLGRWARAGVGKALRRGRPLLRSSRSVRARVLHWVESVGPQVGVRVLKKRFPKLPRSELADLVKRLRHALSRIASRTRCVLEWPVSGAVWAMDHFFPPEPIDNVYKAVLVVRDLGAGVPILCNPVVDERAETRIAELAPLVDTRRAPLVLKNDNGPGFRSRRMQDFLKGHGITQLLSPAYTPSYNGSCEAQIKALKQRSAWQARLDGDAELWRSEHLEAALALTQEIWAPPAAHRIPDEVPIARSDFRALIDRALQKLDAELAAAPDGAIMNKATKARTAIQRALVASGLLKIRRRRFSTLLAKFFGQDL